MVSLEAFSELLHVLYSAPLQQDSGSAFFVEEVCFLPCCSPANFLFALLLSRQLYAYWSPTGESLLARQNAADTSCLAGQRVLVEYIKFP
jgi:hypothetical protein